MLGATASGRRQLDHLRDRFAVAVAVPGRHKRAPAFEQIAAPIAAFHCAFDPMPERLLDYLIWKARSLVTPFFQARAKPMRHSWCLVADSLEQLGQYALADGVGTDRFAIAKHRGFGV